jgi:hypothetical protein
LARAVLLLLVGGLLVPLGSSPASAALPSRGILYDDIDPSPRPIPERDLFSVDVQHDATTGRVWGTYDLQGAPTAATAATYRIWLGTTSGSDCVAFALLGGSTVPGSGRASARPITDSQRTAASPQRTSPAARSARALVTGSFDLTSDLAKAPASCFWFDLAAGGSVGAQVYDTTLPRTALLETIDPTTLAETSEGVRVSKRAWAAVPVVVQNTGDVPATGVSVTLRATSRVKAKQTAVALGTIQPGASATATFRVRLTRGSSGSVSYDVTAEDGVETRRGSFEVATTPTPPKATESLAGLYLWRSRIQTGVTNWDNAGLFFVNRKFAYRGFPESGLPKCRKVTATLTGDGCVRYWYDARSRKLQVDTERGRSLGPKGRPTGVKVGGDSFRSRLVMPRRGTRLAVSLRHQDAFGCPGAACTTSTTTVSFGKDGSYGLGASSGTYAIGRNARLVLQDVDGTRRTSSIWIQADRRGKPQPSRVGLILGDVNYYP